MILSSRRSIVAEANERVSIVSVCRHLGMYVPDDVSHTHSVKVYCPFGFLHADHGAEPAFRIYGQPNNAYCFACTKFFSPVSLAATAWDVDFRQAATQLLEWIGHRPLSMAEEWAKVENPPAPVDHEWLGLALRTYCERIASRSRWAELEVGGGPPQIQLARCLELLDRVKTEEDARLWLERCQTAMRIAIGEVDAD